MHKNILNIICMMKSWYARKINVKCNGKSNYQEIINSGGAYLEINSGGFANNHFLRSFIWILCSKNLLHTFKFFNINIAYIYYYLINNIKHNKHLCETMAELNYKKIPLFITTHKSNKNIITQKVHTLINNSLHVFLLNNH